MVLPLYSVGLVVARKKMGATVNQGANMLHHIYYINANGADNYMIVPFDEIDLTVAFLESLDHEVVAYWPI